MAEIPCIMVFFKHYRRVLRQKIEKRHSLECLFSLEIFLGEVNILLGYFELLAVQVIQAGRI